MAVSELFFIVIYGELSEKNTLYHPDGKGELFSVITELPLICKSEVVVLPFLIAIKNSSILPVTTLEIENRVIL